MLIRLIFKLLFIFSFLLLQGCGVTLEVKDRENEIGVFKEVKADDTFSDTEVVLIKRFCTSLKSKKAMLDEFIRNSNQNNFSFKVSKTKCNEQLDFEKTINSFKITQTAAKYIFEGSEDLIFNEIITDTSSLIDNLCQKDINEESVRFNELSQSVKWFYLFDRTNNKECPVKNNDICIKILKGKKQEAKPRIYAIEYLRIDQSNNFKQNGFVRERKNTSSFNCVDDDQFQVEEQILI